MPLIEVKVLAGVFTPAQKAQMIERLTDVMADIEGEAMRARTWVTIEEIDNGSWGVGGKSVTPAMVKSDGDRAG
jgi:4-oxalocrotonate tautomerase